MAAQEIVFLGHGGSFGDLAEESAGTMVEAEWIWTPILDPTPPNTVRTSAPAPNAIPAGARIEQATFEVVIDPPGRARIGDVAEVRKNPEPFIGDSSYTVDFAGLRTVSAMELPVLTEINTLHQWMGTAFSDSAFFYLMVSAMEITTAPSIEFPEVMTERIKVDLRTSVTAADILAGEVVIPTPPSSAEILVNGVRAWFAPIDATSPSSLPGGSDVHSLAVAVDLVDAIQAAIDEVGSVDIELKTSGPAQMTIEAPELRFLRTHPVVFPEGPARTIDVPTEGAYALDLPLDGTADADGWNVRAVELRSVAELDAPRVQPPVGPVLADDIELALTGERTALVQLPADLLGAYATLSGIRLPVRAGPGGAELSGELLAHDAEIDGPGEPVPDVSLVPLPIDESTGIGYVTLELAEPLEPPPGEGLWVELRASRGELAWGLGESAVWGDLPETRLRWRAPSGAARPLSDVADVAAMRGAVRLVGEADPNRPIDALEVRLVGRAPSTKLTPLPAGVPLSIDLGPADQTSAADQGNPGVVRLELVAAAPGSYTFDGAVIVYRDPNLDGGA